MKNTIEKSLINDTNWTDNKATSKLQNFHPKRVEVKRSIWVLLYVLDFAVINKTFYRF